MARWWFKFNPEQNPADQLVYNHVGSMIGEDMKKLSQRIEFVFSVMLQRGFEESDIESIMDQFREHSISGTFRYGCVPSDVAERWKNTWSVKIKQKNGSIRYEYVMPDEE